MMPLDKLKAELTKPDHMIMTDANVAALFRAPGSGVDIQHSINIGTLERYLASAGLLLTLRSEALSGSLPAKAVAQELIALIDSANVGTFDIHHPRAQAGLSMLVNKSLLTAEQHDDITSLGITQQTIWQEIGMPSGTTDDIMRARVL